MRKILLIVFLMLLLGASAFAEGLGFTAVPDTIYPGKIERISFTAPAPGKARLELVDASGSVVALIRDGISAAEGVNHLTWDGMLTANKAAAPGAYSLGLTLNGESVSRPLTVGAPSPQILSLSALETVDGSGGWPFTLRVNVDGRVEVRLKLGEGTEWKTVFSQAVRTGENACLWDGLADGAAIPAGDYTVQLILTDDGGLSSTPRQMTLSIIPAATPAPAPAQTAAPVLIPSQAVSMGDEPMNYWTLPIGDFDEAGIWDVMMQPLTVLTEKGKTQKDVYRLRLTPDSTIKNNVVGEITYESQGVHILETLDNGWTLVEVYNSSYGPNCASRRGYGVTDDLIRGYVKTSLLKTITPRTEYGLLIDKMEQRMYIFSEGKCIGSLLVSTGLNNAKQSWNETPSGEFVMISRMGGFPAGNLWCSYGMRINGGCAIHEVPYIGNADTPAERRDYSSTVKELGQKASHGCIRVQKAANEQGQNIKWLWDNIKVNTKVLIWDDTGRKRPYPAADDYELYYNPDGGKYYHENQNCPSVSARFLPLSPFTYGELDSGIFAKLTPCAKCATIMRKSQIDKLNAEAMK